MNKLKIEQCELINPHWCSIKFSGQDLAFKSMTELLGRQREYNAYWLPSALGNTGGWIVRVAWLEQYTSRFHNFDRALTLARTKVAQKELKK